MLGKYKFKNKSEIMAVMAHGCDINDLQCMQKCDEHLDLPNLQGQAIP